MLGSRVGTLPLRREPFRFHSYGHAWKTVLYVTPECVVAGSGMQSAGNTATNHAAGTATLAQVAAAAAAAKGEENDWRQRFISVRARCRSGVAETRMLFTRMQCLPAGFP